jgi:hypothetical protein
LHFLQESHVTTNFEHQVAAAADHQFAIDIVNGCFAWKTEPVLTDINIRIPKGLFTWSR